jgi:RNA polymerase sigma-70 factor (ECF subfamily)
VSKKIDDEGIVEELTNDIMMAGMNSLDGFSGKSSEFSWLCSIAKHKIIDYYRKKKLKTILFSTCPIFEEIADKALTPERDVLKNELKDEIKKTFKELGKGYKKILRLKYIEGFKINQIAIKLNLSNKAVESRLIRAKSKFRQVWNYDKK